jgi:addiction module RelE/StbE family toxin
MAYRRRILGRRRLKYSVKFLILAIEDKKEIKSYLSKFYPKTPKRFTTALKKHISNLIENPYMYPIYPEKPDYRRMIVDNYIVLYQIIEEEKIIKIIRILRASWDLPKYL